VLLGISSGKTSIMNRFLNGSFNESVEPTVGVAFFTRVVSLDSDSRIKFEIWDAGNMV